MQMKKEKMGKYINSPQTEIYDKSKVLFGLDQAKKSIKEQDWTIFVEGQMDVIICHQFGYKNVVASSGTSLSQDQLILVKRYSDKIAFSFDMDRAGQLAADRGIEEAMKLDMRIKVIILPKEYKDPADCLQKNPEVFRESLKNSLAMMEYYFNKTIADRDLSKLEEKREVVKILLKMINKLSSSLDQDFWLKKLSDKLDISENILRENLLDFSKPNNFKEENSNKGRIENKYPDLSREEKLLELFLALLLKFPQLIPSFSNQLDLDDLSDPNYQAFYKNLIIYYNKFNNLDYLKFHEYLKKESVDNVDLLEKLSLLGERDYYDFNLDSAKLELLSIISNFKKIVYQKNITELEKEITLAENEGKEDRLNELMVKLKNITDNLKKLS